jgi:alkylation response protein AidB-like acyl-CoA dehydrogenase
MRLSLTDDQQAIAAVAAEVLAAHISSSQRGPGATGAAANPDPGTWARWADLGWFGLGIPEAHGGVGFGPVEEMLLFRELGRYLAPGPLLPTVAAGWIATGAGREDLAAELFAGQASAGLAVGECVLGGEADGLVVVPGESGFELRRVHGLVDVKGVDESVRTSRLTLGPEVARFSEPLLLARAELLVAATQIGIAEAVRDASVAHAKQREQFGRPIGTFQAVKHRCADMAIRCYAAYGQTLVAARHLELRSPECAFHAAAAKTMASNAARRNAADNIQNHGAIGFTQEHIAGRFAKRAQVMHESLDPKRTARRVLEPARQRYEALPGPVADWFQAAATSRDVACPG